VVDDPKSRASWRTVPVWSMHPGTVALLRSPRARQADVPVVRLHSVRHTLALILHRAGWTPADVAPLLGHSLEVHLSTHVPRTKRGVALAASRLATVLAGAVSRLPLALCDIGVTSGRVTET
jgi:integrase